LKTYTVSEVANYFNVAPETVRRWIRKRELQATYNSKKQGNQISESAIGDFIASHPRYNKPVEENLERLASAIKYTRTALEELTRVIHEINSEVETVTKLLKEIEDG